MTWQCLQNWTLVICLLTFLLNSMPLVCGHIPWTLLTTTVPFFAIVCWSSPTKPVPLPHNCTGSEYQSGWLGCLCIVDSWGRLLQFWDPNWCFLLWHVDMMLQHGKGFWSNGEVINMYDALRLGLYGARSMLSLCSLCIHTCICTFFCCPFLMLHLTLSEVMLLVAGVMWGMIQSPVDSWVWKNWISLSLNCIFWLVFWWVDFVVYSTMCIKK